MNQHLWVSVISLPVTVDMKSAFFFLRDLSMFLTWFLDFPSMYLHSKLFVVFCFGDILLPWFLKDQEDLNMGCHTSGPMTILGLFLSSTLVFYDGKMISFCLLTCTVSIGDQRRMV